MTESNEEEQKPLENLTHIDEMRVRRLEENGHYYSILERFDLLCVKFYGGEVLDKEEARDFVLYTKYLLKNGHSDAMRERCRQINEKFIIPEGL